MGFVDTFAVSRCKSAIRASDGLGNGLWFWSVHRNPHLVERLLRFNLDNTAARASCGSMSFSFDIKSFAVIP